MLKPLQGVITPMSLGDLKLDRDLSEISTSKKCGIYFLVKYGEVVYVGQSIDIDSRIRKHSNKEFYKVFYFICEESMLNELENYYIVALAPKLNKTHKDKIELNLLRVAYGNLRKRKLKEIMLCEFDEKYETDLLLSEMKMIKERLKKKREREFLSSNVRGVSGK